MVGAMTSEYLLRAEVENLHVPALRVAIDVLAVPDDEGSPLNPTQREAIEDAILHFGTIERVLVAALKRASNDDPTT
jgi:hypothetical protein